MRNKYPTRTKYNEEWGDGFNSIFDEDYNFCCSTIWNGKKYVITHAWKEKRITVLRELIFYPFVRSQADTKKVNSIIQLNCNHDWDYYPKHAVCLDCGVDKKGDFQKEYDSQQKKDKTPKACYCRIRTFKLNPGFTMERFHEKFIISNNWICLLENQEFFRKKCTDEIKAQCKNLQSVFPGVEKNI
ncbi:MAG: hypothetical protein HeimC3_40960 [Candidatus Heimdallarchaeota archaeon LC_3]|nr:MAG: hypothetical protein HeimC3_40960 [Candidatus Heimdallarchaeota archaeon LC_3]